MSDERGVRDRPGHAVRPGCGADAGVAVRDTCTDLLVSRVVSRDRAGTIGSDSVKVFLGQSIRGSSTLSVVWVFTPRSVGA